MASAIERHIAVIEGELAKVNDVHAGVSEEHAFIKAKIAALDEQAKKFAADKAQLLKESATCAARLGEIEAEQSAYQVQIDALRKAV